ncbi:MAG: hypothetical protein JNK65_00860 [Deltaproteobacteria bacterium]|nr:hypothetical protein [Deltaproteobacteria bacterium]
MKVLETLILIFVTLSILVGLFFLRKKEKHYLKMKTKEALSPQLREEIEKESAENKRKKEKFEGLMSQFSGSSENKK